jgi:hypothetical protein
LGGTRVRLDVIELQLPVGSERLIFQASSDQANFVIFDIVFEVATTKGKCPFHTGAGGVSLVGLPLWPLLLGLLRAALFSSLLPVLVSSLRLGRHNL